MSDKFNFAKPAIIAFTVTCFSVGASAMLITDARAVPEQQPTETVVYSAPAAGMGVTLTSYLASFEDSGIEYLSTTAVADAESTNKYLTANGSSEGKYIVCTAAGSTIVYEDAADGSAQLAKIYTNGVATLISKDGDWCRVVTGDIEGYVKTADFAFGSDAEALDGATHVTKAYINAEELYMFSAQDTSSTVMCVLAAGSEHTVTEADTGTGYTKISVTDVGGGYVKTESILTSTGHIYGITIDEDNAAMAAINEGKTKAAAIEQAKAEAAAKAKAEAEAKAKAEEEARLAAEAAAKAAAAAQAKAAAQQASVQQAQANAQALAGSGEVAAVRQAVVDYACTFVGWLPYVWGGHSLTTGADCSGFTAAVYAKFGYSLSYGSDYQSTQGRSVPISEMTLGDIIVYQGHVAIYIGNGQVVHSPKPGRTVSINSVNMMTILDVRRFIE